MPRATRRTPDLKRARRQVRFVLPDLLKRETMRLQRDTKREITQQGLVDTGKGKRNVSMRVSARSMTGRVILRRPGAYLHLYNDPKRSTRRITRKAWHKSNPKQPRRRELKGIASYELRQRPFSSIRTIVVANQRLGRAMERELSKFG